MLWDLEISLGIETGLAVRLAAYRHTRSKRQRLAGLNVGDQGFFTALGAEKHPTDS